MVPVHIELLFGVDCVRLCRAVDSVTGVSFRSDGAQSCQLLLPVLAQLPHLQSLSLGSVAGGRESESRRLGGLNVADML